MTHTKKVLLIDDHQLFLEGIRHVLSDIDADMKLVLATSVNEAIKTLDEGERYHLMIIDLYLPKMDGFTFLNALKQRNVFTPVLVLSSSTDITDIQRVMQSGALGYLCKGADVNEMRSAIERVLQGKLYLDDEVWSQLDSYPNAQQSKFSEDTSNDNSKLSSRQVEVFALLKDGLSNNDIASVLGITERTVKYHITKMFKQYGVSNRTALVNALQKDANLP